MGKTIEDKTESMIYPEGHIVSYARWNYAKDFSENLKDANGIPMFEGGLFCLACNRAYGLSKLRE